MSRMIEVKTPLEALLVEHALAMAQELQAGPMPPRMVRSSLRRNRLRWLADAS